MGKLFGGRVPQLCVGLDDYYRDVADHLARLVQSIDSTSQAVSNAMSVNIAINTIQENEIIKRLGSYAALVAVPTLIAGVYGMNFDAMPELRWELGYPFAIALMVLIDAILYVRFKRAGWL
jgi:magnesium transporter